MRRKDLQEIVVSCTPPQAHRRSDDIRPFGVCGDSLDLRGLRAQEFHACISRRAELPAMAGVAMAQDVIPR
jgi:hypothetical protein